MNCDNELFAHAHIHSHMHRYTLVYLYYWGLCNGNYICMSLRSLIMKTVEAILVVTSRDQRDASLDNLHNKPNLHNIS